MPLITDGNSINLDLATCSIIIPYLFPLYSLSSLSTATFDPITLPSIVLCFPTPTAQKSKFLSPAGKTLLDAQALA